MIDMVFLLLIFFLVTAVFRDSESIPIDPPNARASSPDSGDPLRIAILPDGSLRHHGAPVPRSQVESLVRRHRATSASGVILETDRHASAGDLVEILDACALAGAEDVRIATRKAQP